MAIHSLPYPDTSTHTHLLFLTSASPSERGRCNGCRAHHPSPNMAVVVAPPSPSAAVVALHHLLARTSQWRRGHPLSPNAAPSPSWYNTGGSPTQHLSHSQPNLAWSGPAVALPLFRLGRCSSGGPPSNVPTDPPFLLFTARSSMVRGGDVPPSTL
jgi:hypothetical protein